MTGPDAQMPAVGAAGIERAGALASTEKAANQNGVCVMNFEQTNTASQGPQNIGDELRASFERAAQPANGDAVGDYDFIKSLGWLFGVELAVGNYSSCDRRGRIEIAGRAPRRVLKGLRKGCDAPLTWRQGIAGDSVAYALPGGLAQLADLLAEAGKVRQ